MVMVGAMRILGTSMPMLSAIDQQPLHLQSERESLMHKKCFQVPPETF